jgi:glutamine amidotransferase
MIGVINYGLGNVLAFANIFKKLGVPFRVINERSDLKNVDKLVLPGVGAFDNAVSSFERSGLRGGVEKLIFENKCPVLGICVGFQMMAVSSEEGKCSGLGWIDANVVRFNTAALPAGSPLPHMGWNHLEVLQDDPILADLHTSRFYFLHSFHVVSRNPNLVLAQSEYGKKFCSIVRHNNIYGIQCHPEKSHYFGVKLLKNFSEI